MSRFIFVLIFMTTMISNATAEVKTHDGWTFIAVREETAPRSSVRNDGGGYGLVIAGNGEAIADGRWVRRVPLPAGEFVGFTARFRASNIEMTARNVVAGIIWLDDKGKEVANAEHAATTSPAAADGWHQINAIYKVPPKAKHAQIELRLRWSPSGEVEWRDAEIKTAQAPTPRKVKVASVNHRPRGLKSAQENLEQFAKYIDEAGAKKADIICLPEAMTLIGRGSDYLAAAETIPGP
ncbi:MAG: hypothetical protein QOE14_1944, partial [Humisphaera sp.]|nr:hypothetical protein [Humisphaera sp.]